MGIPDANELDSAIKTFVGIAVTVVFILGFGSCFLVLKLVESFIK